jgi:hypothetical protein
MAITATTLLGDRFLGSPLTRRWTKADSNLRSRVGWRPLRNLFAARATVPISQEKRFFDQEPTVRIRLPPARSRVRTPISWTRRGAMHRSAPQNIFESEGNKRLAKYDYN